MLAAVLDGHAASRLPRTLVREQRLASSVGASYDMSGRGASLFTVIATPAEGQDHPPNWNRPRSQVGKLARRVSSETELAQVRTQLKAARVYEKDSMFGQAI